MNIDEASRCHDLAPEASSLSIPSSSGLNTLLHDENRRPCTGTDVLLNRKPHKASVVG